MADWETRNAVSGKLQLIRVNAALWFVSPPRFVSHEPSNNFHLKLNYQPPAARVPRTETNLNIISLYLISEPNYQIIPFMEKIIFKQQRKSHIEIGKIYFWTVTINRWQKLLLTDDFKEIVINSLSHLSDKSKIDVFGFVIMPNHIHLILRSRELNGKETAHASFLKFTAHQFRLKLLKENPAMLKSYVVDAVNKKHEFWQRDPLAIELYSPNVAFQKLTYLHNNPLAERWQLAKEPSDYLYSSANFYENGITKFSFLKHLSEEF